MFDNLVEKLKANPKRIVYTEGTDARILESAARLKKDGFLTPVLLGNVEDVKAAAAKGGFDIEGLEIIDPENYDGMDAMVEQMVELRRGKMTADECRAALKKSNYFGTMLVKMGLVDSLLGGVDVKDIPSAQLMNMVSFVFQDSKLLKMSIYDNVRMGKKDATREEVMEALKNAQCEDIIAKLPDGVDTVIGSQGTYVSGGEAQRLSVARAMLKNAPILILDEATAFADPDNEAKVRQAFTKLSAGKTVIMIAHRLSSVVDADRICVLKDGGIVEQGNHEILLGQNGLYAHMWEEYNKSVSWKVGKGEK